MNICASMAMRAVVAAVLASFFMSEAGAKSVSVYKCVGADHQVLYTDQPCKGAELLEVDAGTANPEAAAILARYQETLDRATEQLQARARERTGADWLAMAPPPLAVPPQYDSASGSDPYYIDGLTWGAAPPFVKHRPRNVRPRVLEPKRFVLVPPPIPHR